MKNNKTTEPPNFENPAEAARAWANEYEARIAAEKERDEAKTARGQISSRREATALARTMLANREIDRLKATLPTTQTYQSNEPLAQATRAPLAIEYVAESFKKAELTTAVPLAIGYATVEQVTAALDDKTGFDWHELRKWCNSKKTPPISRMTGDGPVYAWPASAWKAVFGVDIVALREDGVLV